MKEQHQLVVVVVVVLNHLLSHLFVVYPYVDNYQMY
jgi:hypothetical protein